MAFKVSRGENSLLRQLGGRKDLHPFTFLRCVLWTPVAARGLSHADSYIPATILFLRKKRADAGGKPNIFPTSIFKKKLFIVICALDHATIF